MHRLLILLGAVFFGCEVFGQAGTVVSPEVLADRRVTFRVAAPEARKVGLFIDTMKSGEQLAMTNNGSGVWSATTGPIAPGIYIYNFVVDGLAIADPVNPKLKQRARTSASLLEVKGNPPEIWELRANVPRGKVHINYHAAATLGGETREVWVYTPPGYERWGSRRYPVLYLLHGSNDTPAGWTTVGRANFTMDNLLASRSAKEMIIVTPFGHAAPFGSQGANNTELFARYFLEEVMPLVEANYRVANGRENRAIAGFSMGGGHALHIGLGHLDLFSSIGTFSAAVPRDFETRYAALLQNPAQTNKKLDLFWIGCGKDDFLFEASQNLDALLTRHGVEHVYHPTEGAHTFNVWRQYFADFAPLLFGGTKRGK